MSELSQSKDQNITEIKKKVKKQRSLIAVLSGTVLVFAIMYMIA